MKFVRIVAALAAAWTTLATAAFAENAVLSWNEQMIDATRLARNPPPIAALHMATFHAAIFDAVNGITRTHRGWLVNDPAPAGADLNAAVAGAAHKVLMTLWSSSTNPRNLQVAYERALAEIPDGPGKTAGLAWGESVAERILAERATSGYDKPVPKDWASKEPGYWRETPPGFRPPVLPHVANVRPFVLTSPSQFRCPPPPDIRSAQYAEEIAYTGRVGARDHAERDEYQTLSAPFWSDDLGTATPPGHWNVIARDLARRHNLSVPDAARLFALLNLANADAGIACWDTKFFYRTWRPETALREIDPALNPHAKPMPDFIPLMGSPAFPSYVSGHSTFSSAATRVLERFFGTDEIEFTTESDGLPGVVRTFKRLSDCRNEIGMSRIWGGIHFPIDNTAGQTLGLAIGDWVWSAALQPVAAAR